MVLAGVRLPRAEIGSAWKPAHRFNGRGSNLLPPADELAEAWGSARR